MRIAAIIPAFIGLVVFWWLFHGIGMHWDVATQSDVMAAGDTPLVAAFIGGIAVLPFFLIARHMYRTRKGNFEVDIRTLVCAFLYLSPIMIIWNYFGRSLPPKWWFIFPEAAIAIVIFLPFWFVARVIWKARDTYL